MKVLLLRYRRLIVIAFQLTLTALSNYAAFLLRFDFNIPPDHVGSMLRAIPLLLALRGLAFWIFRLNEGLWRYASVWDLQKIVSAVFLSSLVFGLLVRGPLAILPYPRAVFVTDAGLLILLLGGARLLRRLHREFNRLESEKRILILGAGDAGEMIVRDIRNNRFYNCSAVGFIDDDPVKVGRSIHGVKVLGTRNDLPRILDAEQPHEVLVAIPSAEPAQIRQIVRSLERHKVPIKTLPNLRDVLDGRIEVEQIRNLAPEDLLSRPPVDLDAEPVRALVNGRRVLITGAGGSIGSELVRQVAGFGPARLALVERYENSLFEIACRLSWEHPGCAHDAFVADVSNSARIRAIFESVAPDVVFHAAAHKHVPLMERSPCEAVTNNVGGTRVLAETALTTGVDRFVLISSDKAVNPSSVMGATKRVCEQLVRALDEAGQTRFTAVRFGNVLGSNGSVTRLFAEQIARGGPVTVTHPEIRRYFMLVPEAVKLVLHAAALETQDTIYVLEMGEQIRIQDLARNLIRLSGYLPDEEIEVQFVGLRPGEKLFEELTEAGEVVEPSPVSNVLQVKALPVMREAVLRQVEQLERAAVAGDDAEVMRLLSEIVPTFRRAARPTPLRVIGATG